jgi:hypothetical protein
MATGSNRSAGQSFWLHLENFGGIWSTRSAALSINQDLRCAEQGGRAMNRNTDQFQKDLRLNLSIVMTACDRFITMANERMTGTEQELRGQLIEIEKAIEQRQVGMAAARADLNRWSEKITDWKATRQTDKLHARADRYEKCSNTAIEIAAAMMEEAEQWAFRALLARKEAISIQVK